MGKTEEKIEKIEYFFIKKYLFKKSKSSFFLIKKVYNPSPRKSQVPCPKISIFCPKFPNSIFHVSPPNPVNASILPLQKTKKILVYKFFFLLLKSASISVFQKKNAHMLIPGRNLHTTVNTRNQIKKKCIGKYT